ncbi:MAG: bacillithiol system redox-active protein YtxJ [Acidobacteriota bacterium]|nr:bacillithiol system redox-active protein YtxJ [Acidobacteriota bacterium]
MATLRNIDDRTTLDEALGNPRAVLYKHSTRCPVSAYVFEDVRNFAESHPNWKVYVLRVIEQRALSDEVTARLTVAHQSPQVFIIKDGDCVWNASHSDITEQALSQQAHSVRARL